MWLQGDSSWEQKVQMYLSFLKERQKEKADGVVWLINYEMVELIFRFPSSSSTTEQYKSKDKGCLYERYCEDQAQLCSSYKLDK